MRLELPGIALVAAEWPAVWAADGRHRNVVHSIVFLDRDDGSAGWLPLPTAHPSPRQADLVQPPNEGAIVIVAKPDPK